MWKEESEQLLNQAQLYSQQMQNIMTQKTAFAIELNEIRKSLEELHKTKEKTVFKLSGPILIKVDTEEVIKELQEKENMLNLRVKTLEKQEARIKERVNELRTKLIKVPKAKDAEEE